MLTSLRPLAILRPAHRRQRPPRRPPRVQQDTAARNDKQRQRDEQPFTDRHGATSRQKTVVVTISELPGAQRLTAATRPSHPTAVGPSSCRCIRAVSPGSLAAARTPPPMTCSLGKHSDSTVRGSFTFGRRTERSTERAVIVTGAGGPGGPGGPTWPGGPIGPGAPDDPTGPAAPGAPGAPDAPGGPSSPITPGGPGGPGTPPLQMM